MKQMDGRNAGIDAECTVYLKTALAISYLSAGRKFQTMVSFGYFKDRV